jgi:hypothetical protein
MDQIDLLNKEKLVAALRFGLGTSGEHPSKAVYQEGDFIIDVTYYANLVTVIVTHNDELAGKKMIDHGLSELASQYLKQKILSVRMEQSMNKKVPGK